MLIILRDIDQSRCFGMWKMTFSGRQPVVENDLCFVTNHRDRIACSLELFFIGQGRGKGLIIL